MKRTICDVCGALTDANATLTLTKHNRTLVNADICEKCYDEIFQKLPESFSEMEYSEFENEGGAVYD